MKQVSLCLLLVVVVACAPQSPPNTLDARMAGTFNWICGANTPATVNFRSDAKVADLTINGQTTELLRMPTSRGWIYQFGSTQISGSENRMQINSPELGTMDCRPA